MKKIVITSIINKSQKDAGPKAKNDDRKILENNGFTPLDIVVSQSRVKKLLFAELKLKNIIQKNLADEYVIQYPLYSMLIVKKIVSEIEKYSPNAKIIILIHDVESLRLRKGDLKYRKKELEVFNSVDALIVHNQSMKKHLKELGVKVTMVAQEVFDYINNHDLMDVKEYTRKVCFAGNLVKSTFLNKLKLKKSICNVYGMPKPEKEYNNGVMYRGAFPADELPKHLNGDLGLIWDGSSLSTNDGIYGEYTKFNSPHKASLYLSCGIPVIVWDKAGIAPFIRKNDLGIVVKDIENLDDILEKISNFDYMRMKKNAEKYALRIRGGENVIEAIRECEESFFK